mmetsp:Transcript_5939/g.17669  ORF Transcript_5939/g.17669 Transcript_5939/m.17669 type:complete len:221 (+) Transcript_5939:354-1016(+)
MEPTWKTRSAVTSSCTTSLSVMARRRTGTGGTWISGVRAMASRNWSICASLRVMASRKELSSGAVSARRSVQASLAAAITTQKPSCSSAPVPARSLIVGLPASLWELASKASLSLRSRLATANARGVSKSRFATMSLLRAERTACSSAERPDSLSRSASPIIHTWKRFTTMSRFARTNVSKRPDSMAARSAFSTSSFRAEASRRCSFHTSGSNRPKAPSP